jgi:hypothetical protein
MPSYQKDSIGVLYEFDKLIKFKCKHTKEHGEKSGIKL